MITKDITLKSIKEKVYSNERLSYEEGVYLLKSNDLLELGNMANYIKKKKHGNKVFFVQNTHLNYTNVCYMDCKFCAFGIKPDEPKAYVLSVDQLHEKLNGLQAKGFTELHIVGGVNPKLSFEYYETMIKLAKSYNPEIHVQAFTAVELDYIARISKLSIEEVLHRLGKAGLGSILGGGAEVFHPDIRKKIAGHKTDATKWFEIHRIAHRNNINSNASILYGHIEKPEHVIDHFIRLRDLQDETNGFNSFFGFAFQPWNTVLAKEQKITSETTGWYDLKILSVARLMLDNFSHIRAFWMLIGKKLAQISLTFGVDDLDGTVMEEEIVHAAGNNSVKMIPKKEFIDMICEAGMVPIERDTLYRELKYY